MNNRGDENPDEPLAAYTPQQRRTILKGLRILARVAIRSYLRNHGLESRSGAGPVKENGD